MTRRTSRGRGRCCPRRSWRNCRRTRPGARSPGRPTRRWARPRGRGWRRTGGRSGGRTRRTRRWCRRRCRTWSTARSPRWRRCRPPRSPASAAGTPRAYSQPRPRHSSAPAQSRGTHPRRWPFRQTRIPRWTRRRRRPAAAAAAAAAAASSSSGFSPSPSSPLLPALTPAASCCWSRQALAWRPRQRRRRSLGCRSCRCRRCRCRAPPSGRCTGSVELRSGPALEVRVVVPGSRPSGAAWSSRPAGSLHLHHTEPALLRCERLHRATPSPPLLLPRPVVSPRYPHPLPPPRRPCVVVLWRHCVVPATIAVAAAAALDAAAVAVDATRWTPPHSHPMMSLVRDPPPLQHRPEPLEGPGAAARLGIAARTNRTAVVGELATRRRSAGSGAAAAAAATIRCRRRCCR